MAGFVPCSEGQILVDALALSRGFWQELGLHMTKGGGTDGLEDWSFVLRAKITTMLRLS
jgi:hypothetical protein